MQHYDTNQNTKLIIRLCTSLHQSGETLLEIDNYSGFMNFDELSRLVINGTQYTRNKLSISLYLEFVENKPILTVNVYHMG